MKEIGINSAFCTYTQHIVLGGCQNNQVLNPWTYIYQYHTVFIWWIGDIYVTGFFNIPYSLATTQPPQPISILIIEIEPTIV